MLAHLPPCRSFHGGNTPHELRQVLPMAPNANESIRLESFLRGRLNQMKREYVRAINRDLSQHLYTGTLARNSVAIVKELIDELKSAMLSGELEFNKAQNCINESDKTCLITLINEFTQAALQHNRTSCALSNFGREHSPDQVYLDEIAAGIREQLSRITALNS